VNLRGRVEKHQPSSKPESSDYSGTSLPETWILGRWRPAWRRREPGSGSRAELWEPVALMQREKHKWNHHEAQVPRQSTGTDQPVVATKAGNVAGAKGLGRAVAFGVQLGTGGDR